MNVESTIHGNRHQWRLSKAIGEGRFGTVFEAVDDKYRRAAVKVLKSEYAQDDLAVRRFVREISAIQTLQHPAIPELLDQGVTEEGAPFFAMEQLCGATLEELRLSAGGRLDIDFVLQIAKQALDALDYAHTRGWVHRDITPSNLFVTTHNELKLLDLGLCRAIESSGVLASITGPALIGTPGFTAPERTRGEFALPDPRSDIWSLGATLFVLLSGQLLCSSSATPLPSDEFKALHSQLAEFPPEVIDWLSRAIAFDTSARWESAAAMRLELERVLSRCSIQPHAFASPSQSSVRNFKCPPTQEAIGHFSERVSDYSLCVVHSPGARVAKRSDLAFDKKLTIGRDEREADLHIPDQLVSRAHATIFWDEVARAFRLVDRASRNGVYVNGARVNVTHLKDGDIIRVGDSLIAFARALVRPAREVVAHLAGRNLPTLLLVGEQGTGKRQLARMLHQQSLRSGKFLVVDCALLTHNSALTALLPESSSLESANDAIDGLFAKAAKGTLLFNHISDMPASFQSALCEAFEREATGLGGAEL